MAVIVPIATPSKNLLAKRIQKLSVSIPINEPIKQLTITISPIRRAPYLDTKAPAGNDKNKPIIPDAEISNPTC